VDARSQWATRESSAGGGLSRPGTGLIANPRRTATLPCSEPLDETRGERRADKRAGGAGREQQAEHCFARAERAEDVQDQDREPCGVDDGPYQSRHSETAEHAVTHEPASPARISLQRARTMGSDSMRALNTPGSDTRITAAIAKVAESRANGNATAIANSPDPRGGPPNSLAIVLCREQPSVGRFESIVRDDRRRHRRRRGVEERLTKSKRERQDEQGRHVGDVSRQGKGEQPEQDGACRINRDHHPATIHPVNQRTAASKPSRTAHSASRPFRVVVSLATLRVRIPTPPRGAIEISAL
jgi:hypothetical protein